MSDKKDDNKETALDTAGTVDAAICGLAAANINFDIAFIVPVLLHMMSQAIQIVVLVMFFSHQVEPMESAYEGAQWPHVQGAIKASLATGIPVKSLNATNGGGVKDENGVIQVYPAVHAWLAKQCMSNAGDIVNIFAISLLVGNAMKDLIKIIWSMKTVLSLPSKGAKEADKISLEKPPAKFQITEMKCLWKVITTLLIFLPHIWTHAMIAYQGAKFLSLLSKVNKIIKSFIKLYFISKFDAQIAKAFTAPNFAKLLKVSVYVAPKDAKPHPMWSSFCSGVFRVFFAFFLAVIIYEVVFDRVGTLDDLCLQYQVKFPEQVKTYCIGNDENGVGGTCGMDWSNPFNS